MKRANTEADCLGQLTQGGEFQATTSGLGAAGMGAVRGGGTRALWVTLAHLQTHRPIHNPLCPSLPLPHLCASSQLTCSPTPRRESTSHRPHPRGEPAG